MREGSTRGIMEKEGTKVTCFVSGFGVFTDAMGAGGQRQQRTRPPVTRIDGAERDLLLNY